MKCALCGKKIYQDLSFKTLFTFHFYCKTCRNLLKAKMAVYPLDFGYLAHYYYFLLDKEYEDKIMDKIHDTLSDILEKEKDSLIIFIEESDIPYLKYINICQNITLVSSVYYPIEEYIYQDEDNVKKM